MSEGLVGTKCMWMRGGTSKGGYFLAADLPGNREDRDRFLLSVMGSPDARQIDGMGGADPLTSKVAIVEASARDDADVSYLFLQVSVDKALVSDAQNCGNLLAGVGPFAIERGLVKAEKGETSIRIYMENTGKIATSRISTPDGRLTYVGKAAIDGVPGIAAPILLAFEDTAGSTCGSLLPTGNVVDRIEDTDVTCIDNGMPTIILRATDLGISGQETRQELESNNGLRERLENIRLAAGPKMNLGNVSQKTVPKMTMVSTATKGGTLSTRTFIPHRCHASIGVLGAVSVATACLVQGSIANELAQNIADRPKEPSRPLKIEHPIGETTIITTLDNAGSVASAAILRTARKLFDGEVFAPANMNTSHG